MTHQIALRFANERISSYLTELDQLAQAEFPYDDSRTALEALRSFFANTQVQLNSFQNDSDPETVLTTCANALADLFNYTPLAGWILRSTNVRNAFELFGPLRRLARKLLQGKKAGKTDAAHLVISSEWDYSPMEFSGLEELKLPSFVFIGFPASESSNPLIFPLAGHELGHPLWKQYTLSGEIDADVKTQLVAALTTRWEKIGKHIDTHDMHTGDLQSNMTLLTWWDPARVWAMEHATEYFCDFVGLRLFGESYLKALGYLLSPRIPRPLSPSYPDTFNRAKWLVTAASRYKISVPPDYQSLFIPGDRPPMTSGNSLLLEVAGVSAEAVAESLIGRVSEIIEQQGCPFPTDSGRDEVLARFRYAVPAEKCRTIADIINAGWIVWEDNEFWNHLPFSGLNKARTVKELVLKNIEVFEYEARVGS